MSTDGYLKAQLTANPVLKCLIANLDRLWTDQPSIIIFGRCDQAIQFGKTKRQDKGRLIWGANRT